MDNEIKYNINTYVNTDGKSKGEIIKAFNQNLLKLIILFEKTSS